MATNQVKLTDVERTVLDSLKYTSTKIRYLLSHGYTRGQTAKVLGCIYQHVFNESVRAVKHPKEATPK